MEETLGGIHVAVIVSTPLVLPEESLTRVSACLNEWLQSA